MSELHEKLGALLRQERERQGISLEDISASLNASEESITNIELGNIAGLPSEIYFDLFAKSYAQSLSIDYTATRDALKEELGQTLEPDPEGSTSETSESDNAPDASEAENGDKSSVKKILYFVGGIIVLLLGFLIVNTLWFSDSESEAEAGLTDSLNDDLSGEIVMTPKPSGDSLTAGLDWNMPEYEPPSDLKLTMQARGESWAAVTSDGDTVIYRTLTIGRLYEVSARYRLNVSIGVPSVVDVTLNGQPVNLRRPSGRIHSVDIDQLNASGYFQQSTSQPATSNTERPTTEKPQQPPSQPQNNADSTITDDSLGVN